MDVLSLILLWSHWKCNMKMKANLYRSSFCNTWFFLLSLLTVGLILTGNDTIFNKYKNNRIVLMTIITKDTANNTYNLVTYGTFEWIAFRSSFYKIKETQVDRSDCQIPSDPIWIRWKLLESLVSDSDRILLVSFALGKEDILV